MSGSVRDLLGGAVCEIDGVVEGADGVEDDEWLGYFPLNKLRIPSCRLVLCMTKPIEHKSETLGDHTSCSH